MPLLQAHFYFKKKNFCSRVRFLNKDTLLYLDASNICEKTNCHKNP